jgi:hypothetical protein
VFWRNHNFIGVIAMKLPKNNWDDKNGWYRSYPR